MQIQQVGAEPVDRTDSGVAKFGTNHANPEAANNAPEKLSGRCDQPTSPHPIRHQPVKRSGSQLLGSDEPYRLHSAEMPTAAPASHSVHNLDRGDLADERCERGT
jgi:hypothetical protein